MASSNSIWPEDFLIFPGLFLLLRCGRSCHVKSLISLVMELLAKSMHSSSSATIFSPDMRWRHQLQLIKSRYHGILFFSKTPGHHIQMIWTKISHSESEHLWNQGRNHESPLKKVLHLSTFFWTLYLNDSYIAFVCTSRSLREEKNRMISARTGDLWCLEFRFTWKLSSWCKNGCL